VRITRRFAATALTGAAAAGGLAFGGPATALAATPLAATNPSTFLIGPMASHSGCDVVLFSARVSSSTPAEVFSDIGSAGPGHACTTFVERSVTGKTVWAVASAQVTLPSVSGAEGIANTGFVYDGPGYKARACVRAGASTAVYCTSALSLAKGAGTATAPPASPVYGRKQAEVFRPPTSSSGGLGICAGNLTSSTMTKKAGATVLGALISVGDPCTAWIQSTANGGKTWTTVSPVLSYRGPAYPGEAVAFTARYADGTGHLARLCVRDMTSNKQNCSGTW